MKFLYLRLTNFLSYKSLELNLTDIAYTSVTGPNGAGKSTVPAAIPWILYGTLRVTGDRDSIINDESTEAAGYLDVQDNDGNTWQIARGRTYNGSGWVRIFQWDKEQDDWVQFGDHMNSTAQEQINIIVGLSEDAYYSLVLVDQSSGGTRFIGADSNTRRSILHGLVPELGEWSKYHYTTASNLTDAKRELGTIDQSIENSNRFISEQEDQRAETVTKIGSLSQESIDADIADTEKRIAKLTRKIGGDSANNISEIESRIEAARSKHSLDLATLKVALEATRDELDDLDTADKSLTDAKSELDKLDTEFDEVKEERKTLKKSIKGLQAEEAELQEKVSRLEPKIATADEASSKKRNRLADIREQIDGLELAIDKDNGECPVCNSPLSKNKCHSLVGNLEAERDEIAASMAADTTAYQALKTKLLDNKTLLTSTTGKIQRAESRIESLGERLDSLEHQADSKESKVDELKKALSELRTEDEIEAAIQSQKSQIELVKSTHDDTIMAILERELETAKAKDRNDQLQSEIDELKAEQRVNNERNQTFSRLAGSLATTDATITSLNEKRTQDVQRQVTLTDDIGDLTWLERALSQKGIPSMLLDSVLGAIEYEQNLILEQLSDSDQMRVEFRQSKELKSRDGTKDVLDIIVHTPGGRERSIESFSFGERVRLSISNVFAMIKVFNERSGGIARTLFLDEPLGPLDEKSIPAFIEVLRVAMNTGIVDSIWVITHDRTVVDSLPQEVRVSQDETGASIVTVV